MPFLTGKQQGKTSTHRDFVLYDRNHNGLSHTAFSPEMTATDHIEDEAC